MVMRIEFLVTEEPTPFDGQYLVEYDPAREGTDPCGEPLLCHLVTTHDVTQARKFPTVTEAVDFWNRSHGLRPDGQPNRPLTAFHVSVMDEDVARRET